MDKQIYKAAYKGKAYKRAYGKKFYKEGIQLKNIKDKNGNIIIDKQVVNMSKAFNGLTENQNISFKAVLTEDNRLLYISNVVIEG